MIKDLFKTIRLDYSGKAAFDDVAAIVRHHRIQASPGYRAAAAYVLEELRSTGMQAEIETFPANFRTKFWTASSFQEWYVDQARLDLIEPVEDACKLADYRDVKLSVVQRSASFDGTAEVVLLQDGLDEAEYTGLDLAGKVVLTRGELGRVHQLAVEQHSAAGILTYGMRKMPPVREAIDLPDALQYTSFWWTNDPEEVRCFGFVLSPRQGQWLADLVRSRAEKSLSPVRISAHVAAHFYDGAIEVVSALIPGELDEEVVVVSHLCHPQPSANDNASGAATALEVARTLQRLICNGSLPRPRRGIRFLWVPEMLGSYAYLSAHEDRIPSMLAGINLDMVGEDQAQTGASFLIERPPDAMSSFVPVLLERLRAELFYDTATHTGLGNYPLFRYTTTGFSGGSDHYIFSDPTVGVPMAMFIQVPDKFYHTSADTLDRVDPAMLARVGALTSAYAFFLANAGKDEAAWLSSEMQARFDSDLTMKLQGRMTNFWETRSLPAIKEAREDLQRLVVYQVERYKESLATLERLWDGMASRVDRLGEEAATQAQEKLRACLDRLEAYASLPGLSNPAGANEKTSDEWEIQAANTVPQRRYRGPISWHELTRGLSLNERLAWDALLDSRSSGGYTMIILAEYWADGRRTTLDIINLIEMETGIRDAELVVKYFALLSKLGAISLSDSPSS